MCKNQWFYCITSHSYRYESHKDHTTDKHVYFDLWLQYQACTSVSTNRGLKSGTKTNVTRSSGYNTFELTIATYNYFQVGCGDQHNRRHTISQPALAVRHLAETSMLLPAIPFYHGTIRECGLKHLGDATQRPLHFTCRSAIYKYHIPLVSMV